MKVVIFCGGKGTRLNEETEFKPKPLVEIGGLPIIWHIMKLYAHYGHNEFILPLGYKGDLIKQFFLNFEKKSNDFTLNFLDDEIKIHNSHKKEDWKIHFIDTGQETKTSLRLWKIKHLLQDEEDFLLTYGDGLSDVNINQTIDFHKEKRKIITLTGIKHPSRFGIIKEKEGTIEEFNEKPKENKWINGGFMVINKKIFDFPEIKEDKMIVDYLLPLLVQDRQVGIYKHEGFWHSMDTYRDYLELNKIYKDYEGSAPWKIWETRNPLKR
jgi:glucose-1-phosphate cytidylyltransferase